VEYGRYDWRRIVATVKLVPDIETQTPRIGISSGGRHAAEGLIIARYMMFNQVYFHKTRVILDYHLQRAVKEMLPGGISPLHSVMAWMIILGGMIGEYLEICLKAEVASMDND
jgi:HD superfamily phosphohydrolase